jgi:hypothetical protein
MTMLQIPFDTSKEGFGANSNRKNGKTSHGIIELYPDFQMPCWLSLDIRGPAGAYRGSAIIDKETARKVGAELLNWAAGDVVHRAAGNLILTNNERAATGEKAVMAVFKEGIESGGIDLTTGIYDLVADLLHLARENDIEPDYIIHMAQMHFDAEVEEESLNPFGEE